MTTLQIELPPKLIPVFEGAARVRGAFGGRGSAKTRSFAKMAATFGLMFAQAGKEGIILGCREFMNSLDDSSMAEIKAAILSEPWLKQNYEIGEKFIRTICRRVEFKFAGLRHNLDSIKSKARILLCWVDEAEPVTDYAWSKLIPTIREEDSELWVTWNPEREKSATNQRFRVSRSDDVKVVELNWRDNPWFPKVLDRERQRDQKERPDTYDHIWEGDYIAIHEGAYFAKLLKEAARQKRICNLSPDPLMSIRTYHDIGGSGAKADAYAIWVAQFVGREIRILDYYESQGQVLAHHVNWMRENGYEKAEVFLPHDGVNSNNLTGKRYEDHWREAGFSVESVPNQGAGAAMMRVRAVQRLLPSIWFNELTTDAGREALAWYHEKRDQNRGIGLGPNHDWSSHCADAFGLMCMKYEPPIEEDDCSDFYSGSGRARGAGGFLRS